MAAVPHFLSSTELVVEIDFARGWMLVGELARRNEPATVVRHFRWRFCEDVSIVENHWSVDRPGRSAVPRPAFDAEPHEWRCDVALSNNAAARKLTVSYERSFVTVRRNALVKALDSFRKLANGKALGVDGLLTLHVHSRGLSMCSHGKQRMHVDLSCFDDTDARDGFGTVVVLGEALRAVAKALTLDNVHVQVEPRGPGRCVQLYSERVWTVDATPVVSEAKREPVDLGLTPAIARALEFASTDDSRPNLNCVMLDGRGDHVHVVATDGHRMYRERVETSAACEALGMRKRLLSRAVLASLRPGKRSGSYRFAFDGDDVVIACDGRTATCAPSGAVFPPYDQLIPSDLLAYGDALVELAPEDVTKLRAWLSIQVKADRQYDNGNRYPVQLEVSADGTIGLRVCDTDHAIACPGKLVSGVSPSEGKPLAAVRLFPVYLADALEAVEKGQPLHVAVRAELDPVLLLNSARVVVVMPTRW